MFSTNNRYQIQLGEVCVQADHILHLQINVSIDLIVSEDIALSK